MQLLEIGLLALALWTMWYLVSALSAFCDLRDLFAQQGHRENLFLGLHRSIPGQGRGHPCGDRFTPSDGVSPSSLSGLHEASLPPYYPGTAQPPFENAYERACVMGNHDMWCEEEAAQAVLRG